MVGSDNDGGCCHDQTMASTLCAYCGVKSNMTPVWSSKQRRSAGSGIVRWGLKVAVTCDNCREINVVVGTVDADFSTSSADHMRTAIETARNQKWFPYSVVSPEYPDVPEAVAAAATEAHQSRSIGANMAAILMARTAIEATAKDKGIKTGSLLAKIDALKDGGLIRSSVAAAAHAIRHLGNDMAHGDIGDKPDGQDATDVLRLLDIVLDEVYQAEALTQSILARRGKG